MDLLQKFSNVEIRAADRITEADRSYCQKHQKAYEIALEAFHQLLILWQDVCAQQLDILGSSSRFDNAERYMVSKKFPKLDVSQIRDHIVEVHKKFISTIVSYLNATYHLTIDEDDVADHFIPPLEEDEDEAVETAFRSIVLHYEHMIELILSWFDGRSFSEQGPYELLSKCHAAAWREQDHKQKFEQKKAVVTFYGACYYGYTHGCEQWGFHDGMKDVLKGLAHFETGAFDKYPGDLDYLIPDNEVIRYDVWEFESCYKLERIKMFKNGRMDIRFTNEGYARQFVADYLGTVW